MTLTPNLIYQQNIDKQRIVLTGSGRTLIGKIVRHVLTFHNRKFDYVADNQSSPILSPSLAPVLLIETADPSLEFHHHVVVLSQPDIADLTRYEALAKATPKGGTLIYAETNATVKAIGTKEIIDVQTIPFGTYAHEVKNGITYLITSTNEKFPLKVGGSQHLECLRAARELLKKIGISSGQFYKAVSTFE